jgi:hypothetical protein
VLEGEASTGTPDAGVDAGGMRAETGEAAASTAGTNGTITADGGGAGNGTVIMGRVPVVRSATEGAADGAAEPAGALAGRSGTESPGR